MTSFSKDVHFLHACHLKFIINVTIVYNRLQLTHYQLLKILIVIIRAHGGRAECCVFPPSCKISTRSRRRSTRCTLAKCFTFLDLGRQSSTKRDNLLPIRSTVLPNFIALCQSTQEIPVSVTKCLRTNKQTQKQ